LGSKRRDVLHQHRHRPPLAPHPRRSSHGFEHAESRSIYEKLDTIADHYHYDRSGSWSESRDGKANSLGGGHAHIGMMIYQADQWPENTATSSSP
jgi:hypothetical protein